MDTNINADLSRERSRCTFDVEKLTNLIRGGPHNVQRKRFLENIMLQDPVFKHLDRLDTTSDRSQQYEETLRRHIYFLKRLYDLGITNKDERNYMQSILLPHTPGTFNLHYSMFIETIEQHGTEEQKRKWLPMAENMEIIGTYAQTEIGHGSFVRGLETTATYDKEHQEFILNSPTVSSIKYWPGNLGKTANYCVLMAQLFTEGRCHGVHPFIVPLRSRENHQPFAGVKCGDIGPKLGYTNMTNGFLRLTNYRIPRENMLMKYSQVLPDGTYREPSHKKLTYGTMVAVRANLAKKHGLNLAQACTIAIRYSAVRRQTEAKPGGEELQIMDYQTQQLKIFTQLANAYAVYFAGDELVKVYNRLRYRIDQGDLSQLLELHAFTASLKAYSTNTYLTGSEECRLACGGHGYSHASGFPKLFAEAGQAPIVEGISTVLFLQTARYLVKSYRKVLNGEKLNGFVAYLNMDLDRKSDLDNAVSLEFLLDALQHRACRSVRDAELSIKKLTDKGMSYEIAWNLSGISLTRAAEAHCEAYVLNAFKDVFNRPGISNSLSKVLTSLCSLYAVNILHRHQGEIIKDGYINNRQLELIENKLFDLLAELRPDAVGLVDAFDFPDTIMESCLGRYDGQVYQALYEFAKKSPLNRSDVLPSYFSFIQPLTGQTAVDALSKL